MSPHDRICTGSVGEKLIIRTGNGRSSVRETISRALKTTLGFGEKSTSRRVEEKSSSRESSSNTSDLPRSASSSGSSLVFRPGFGQTTLLPSRGRSHDIMSSSMYEKSHSRCHHRCSSSSATYIPSSPSLTTLKDFDMMDYDDAKSSISVASTSKIFSSNPRRVKKQTLRTFLDSPVRLRRREPQKIDAVEAGFEPEPLVPRCHSTHSLSYNNSQFQPSDLTCTDGRENVREYATPLAVVGPRRVRCRPTGSTSEVNNVPDVRRNDNRRTSLQMLNAAHLGYNGSSQFTASQDMIHRPPLTPQSHRRSVQHVERTNTNDSFRIDSTVVTSTPVGKKVAVAPIPHKQRNHSYRDGEQNRSFHQPQNDSTRIHTMYTNERLVDGPTSPSRVACLEQRVKELEAAMITNGSSVVIPVTPTLQSKHAHNRSSTGPSTQLFFSSPAPVAQQIMAKSIVEKEVEIERLQSQLRKAYDQMENQQREYDDKLRRFKRDSDSSKEELRQVMNKLNALDDEYIKYREQAALVSDMPSEAYEELSRKLNEQERKMAKLREELSEKEAAERQCSKLQRELEYLELQNTTLNKDLDSKEESLKRLEQNLATLQKEASMYHQSCSSGSTPLAEDTESLVDVRSPYYGGTKPYTKAHSTLGTNMSPLPTPKSNLRKSLSNFTIDATKKDDITPAMSQSLRSQQKKLADTRVLTKCLRDVLSECASGNAPDIRKFLGIRGDSMSESEAESIEFDSTPLSMATAERMILKQEESIKKLEQDMEHMRYLIHEVYCAKIEDRGDNPCAIQ